MYELKKNWNDGATRPRKKFDYTFNCFGTKHECDRQTERQTDRHRATASTVASRDKNIVLF